MIHRKYISKYTFILNLIYNHNVNTWSFLLFFAGGRGGVRGGWLPPFSAPPQKNKILWTPLTIPSLFILSIHMVLFRYVCIIYIDILVICSYLNHTFILRIHMVLFGMFVWYVKTYFAYLYIFAFLKVTKGDALLFFPFFVTPSTPSTVSFKKSKCKHLQQRLKNTLSPLKKKTCYFSPFVLTYSGYFLSEKYISPVYP